MSKKNPPKKTTSVQKYNKKTKIPVEVEADTDSESDEEIVEKKEKPKKNVNIKKEKPQIIPDTEIELVNCNECKKIIDLDKDNIYDYCEDCNTNIKQCSLKELLSVFTALNAQLKQLYNDNSMLCEKIKILEGNKISS